MLLSISDIISIVRSNSDSRALPLQPGGPIDLKGNVIFATNCGGVHRGIFFNMAIHTDVVLLRLNFKALEKQKKACAAEVDWASNLRWSGMRRNKYETSRTDMKCFVFGLLPLSRPQRIHGMHSFGRVLQQRALGNFTISNGRWKCCYPYYLCFIQAHGYLSVIATDGLASCTFFSF